MRYRSFIHFLMSNQGRKAFFKIALTAYMLLGLLAVVMGFSWCLAKYNSWIDSRASSCLDRLIPNCMFSQNFDRYYYCALEAELQHPGSVPKKIVPLLTAFGNNEDTSGSICSSQLRLEKGNHFVFIERQFQILSGTVSDEHGSIAILAVVVMIALSLFERWLRWVFT